ncbi:MAG: hypothetical protein PsegKO_23570 [Pseudohongiellaceae bacterium]
MSEWLKEHAWKVCSRKRIEGSTAAQRRRQRVALPRRGEGFGFAKCRINPSLTGVQRTPSQVQHLVGNKQN